MPLYDMVSYLNSRRHERKQMAVDYKGGECCRCGYDKSLNALVFHHRDPSTKGFPLDSRNLANRGWEACMTELDKCDLLCANCHAEEHAS